MTGRKPKCTCRENNCYLPHDLCTCGCPVVRYWAEAEREEAAEQGREIEAHVNEDDTIRAEDARSPHDPRLTAYEAGRWYALHDRALPAGATADCQRGYWHVVEHEA